MISQRAFHGFMKDVSSQTENSYSHLFEASSPHIFSWGCSTHTKKCVGCRRSDGMHPCAAGSRRAWGCARSRLHPLAVAEPRRACGSEDALLVVRGFLRRLQSQREHHGGGASEPACWQRAWCARPIPPSTALSPRTPAPSPATRPATPQRSAQGARPPSHTRVTQPRTGRQL